MAFNQNIPQPTDKLSNSQVQFLANNLALDASFGVNHTTFSNATANNGFHTIINQITQGGNPPTGVSNVIYAKNYTPNFTGATVDTQLFVQTFAGGVSQLTGDSALTDGWQWIGGVLLQWGRVIQSIPSNTFTGTVTFKDRGPSNQGIPFPTACFVVIPTGLYTSPTPLSEIGIAIKSSTLSATKFDWATNTDSSQYTGFNWIAIGN